MASDPDEKFANRVRLRREEQGLSQADLAHRISTESGLSFQGSTVYKIEQNKRKVTVAEAVAISSALRTSLVEMVDLGVDSAQIAKDVLMDRGVSALIDLEQVEVTLSRVANQQRHMRSVLVNYRDLFGIDPAWVQLSTRPSLREFWGPLVDWSGPQEFLHSWLTFMGTHGERYSDFLDVSGRDWLDEAEKLDE